MYLYLQQKKTTDIQILVNHVVNEWYW